MSAQASSSKARVLEQRPDDVVIVSAVRSAITKVRPIALLLEFVGF